jgi:hypothetical protein
MNNNTFGTATLERDNVVPIINNQGVVEYYKCSKDGNGKTIKLEKDKELYEKAEKIIDSMEAQKKMIEMTEEATFQKEDGSEFKYSGFGRKVTEDAKAEFIKAERNVDGEYSLKVKVQNQDMEIPFVYSKGEDIETGTFD